MSNEKPVMLTQQDNPLAMLAREVKSLRAQQAESDARYERVLATVDELKICSECGNSGEVAGKHCLNCVWGLRPLLAAKDRELEALREDRRRLDWLDKQKPSGWEEVLFEYHDGELVQVNFCHTDYDDDSQYYTGYTWRLAIDAALAAAPDDEKKRRSINDPRNRLEIKSADCTVFNESDAAAPAEEKPKA